MFAPSLAFARATLACAAVALVAAACSSFSGAEEPPGGGPLLDAGAEASAPRDADAPPPVDGGLEDAGADGAPPPPCVSIQRAVIAAIEDTSPAYGECAGSISRGADAFMNIGVGVAMLKFRLDAAMATSLGQSAADGTIRVRLELAVDPTPAGAPRPGAVAAHVMRNDWTAGVGVTYGGADMCRRGNAAGAIGDVGWGAVTAPPADGTRIATPADYGPVIGQATFDATTSALSIALSEADIRRDWPKYAGQQASSIIELSFLLESVAAPGQQTAGTVVVASNDQSSRARPQLVIELCRN